MIQKCTICNERFISRNSRHRCCGKTSCQRLRKTQWQRQKLKQDSAYRENQRDSQRRWREKNPHYMQAYRADHPEYVKKNKEQQKLRRMKKKSKAYLPVSDVDNVVKMDVARQFPSLISGTYDMVPAGVVKMDAIRVHLTVLQGFS